MYGNTHLAEREVGELVPGGEGAWPFWMSLGI